MSPRAQLIIIIIILLPGAVLRWGCPPPVLSQVSTDTGNV